jgi:hypothetical protein
MVQQFGFRASRNLAEAANINLCWDNLNINRDDLPLIEGTSDSGVTSADYYALLGLSSSLEDQVVALVSGATSSLTAMEGRISKFGDSGIGTLNADIVNNDRPYYDAANTIFGPSIASYFSPAASGFSAGAEYKLGPVSATTTTVSGLDYTGATEDWSNYFVEYRDYLNVQEEPSWSTKQVPLYLPPPSQFSSNKLWLDSEFSNFAQNGSGVKLWRDVFGRGFAEQIETTKQPILSTNQLNGKPGVVFDGSNDFMNMGNISGLFPAAATLVIVATLGEPNSRGDTDYNLFGTLNNTANRWRGGAGNGNFGLFTSSIQSNFPAGMPANGTYVFTVRASQEFGIEIRTNKTGFDEITNQFFPNITYDAGSLYVIGANANGSSGFFNGTIFAIALFDEVLTNKELKTVEQYFSWRYDFLYDPDRSQPVELEDKTSLTDENDVTIVLG